MGLSYTVSYGYGLKVSEPDFPILEEYLQDNNMLGNCEDYTGLDDLDGGYIICDNLAIYYYDYTDSDSSKDSTILILDDHTVGIINPIETPPDVQPLGNVKNSARLYEIMNKLQSLGANVEKPQYYIANTVY